MLRKVNKENGSITIEATISLTVFMFAIFTILTIVNVCIVQAKMSYALNNTAKEISQYSYLYSLTGLNKTQAEMYESGKEATKDVGKILEDINAVYNEIENLGSNGVQTPANIEDVLNSWNALSGSVTEIKNNGVDIYQRLESIAEDPKNLMFGIVKMAASGGMDFAKSKFIMENLAKSLVKKHLVSEKGGDVEAYLKSMFIVPSANGKYLDGISFSGSTLFPNGSSEIRLNASYDIKVIQLLPIDFKFHFEQSAVTLGWLGGDVSFTPATKYEENNTLWTQGTTHERAAIIRNLAIKDYKDQGYKKVSGLTNAHLYSEAENEFIMISSMNPLWSESGSKPVKLEDVNEKVIEESITMLCGKINLDTKDLDKVKVKNEKDGVTTREEKDCNGATQKVVLVIPEDAGLKEKVQKIIDSMDTKGVKVELVSDFGNGVNSTEIIEGGTAE